MKRELEHSSFFVDETEYTPEVVEVFNDPADAYDERSMFDRDDFVESHIVENIVLVPEINIHNDSVVAFSQDSVVRISDLRISSPPTAVNSQPLKTLLLPDQSVFNIGTDTTVVACDPVSPFNQADQSFTQFLPENLEISSVTEKLDQSILLELDHHTQDQSFFSVSDDFEQAFDNNQNFNNEAVEIVEQHENTSVAGISYREKLFSKYRYKMFNPSDARNSMYTKSYRPGINNWSKCIRDMVKSQLLSCINVNGVSFYKFNLKTETSGKFLTHDYMIKSLTRSINKEPLKRISAGNSRKKLLKAMRPNITDWDFYLQDLVNDSYLNIDETSVIHYYTLYSAWNY